MADKNSSWNIDISVTMGVKCDARLCLYYFDSKSGRYERWEKDSYKCDGFQNHNKEKLLQFEEVTHDFHFEFDHPIHVDRSQSYIKFGYITQSGYFSTMVATMTKTLLELDIEFLE